MSDEYYSVDDDNVEIMPADTNNRNRSLAKKFNINSNYPTTTKTIWGGNRQRRKIEVYNDVIRACQDTYRELFILLEERDKLEPHNLQKAFDANSYDLEVRKLRKKKELMRLQEDIEDLEYARKTKNRQRANQSDVEASDFEATIEENKLRKARARNEINKLGKKPLSSMDKWRRGMDKTEDEIKKAMEFQKRKEVMRDFVKKLAKKKGWDEDTLDDNLDYVDNVFDKEGEDIVF